MKIFIVDDETPARERLQRLINQIDNCEVVGEASNGREAVEKFSVINPDIILLDIRMPVMDGIETARHLMAHESPPAIIFTTAYSDHALEAFETHAVDYLVKPIRAERLEEALASAQKMSRAQTNSQINAFQFSDPSSEPEASIVQNSRSHICIKNRGNLELIPIEDIIYFQAEHKYITLRHSKGEALIEESLVNLEKEFESQILRIHRNALVFTDKLKGLEKYKGDSMVIVFDKIEDRLNVSRRHLPMVRQTLKSNT